MFKKILGSGIMVFSFFLVNFQNTSAQVDPSTLPLVQFANLQHLGAFRGTEEIVSGHDLSYGGHPIAFNPANKSLFIGTLYKSVGEMSIPAWGQSSTPSLLPVAKLIQSAFKDPTEGNYSGLSDSSISLSGLFVRGGKLIGSAAIYYDAMGTAKVSHFSRSTDLSAPSFSGWSRVGGNTNLNPGFFAGWMADVPPEWQTKLGGTAITGQCCLSIITRTSFGPSAFAFDPTKIGEPSVNATPLLYYDSLHPTLGNWGSEVTNTTFGASTSIGGMVIVPGTRSALFFGVHGLGEYCYGYGTSDQTLHMTRAADGQMYCYDPTATSKGPHAYPYRNQIWAYDLNDFVAVKEGRKQPWEIVPYGVWPFDLTTAVSNRYPAINGVTMDQQTGTIYLSHYGGSILGCCGVMPVIHGYKVNIGTVLPPPPPSTPTTITSIVANSVTSSSANITWSTTQSSTSFVDFGFTTSYGQRKYSTGTFTHSALLTGLTPGSYYNYKVTATDASGNTATSPNSVFFTLLSSTSPTPLPPPPPTASTSSPTPLPPPPVIPPPLPLPTPPTPGNKFVASERVRVTVSKLNVRSTASGSGRNLGKQTLNAQGTVVSGPTLASGYNWYYIDYDKAPDGYSADLYLEKVVVAVAPQSPEEIQKKITELKAQLAQLIEVLKAWLAR